MKYRYVKSQRDYMRLSTTTTPLTRCYSRSSGCRLLLGERTEGAQWRQLQPNMSVEQSLEIMLGETTGAETITAVRPSMYRPIYLTTAAGCR
jgi:hypothetical protein